MVPPSFSFPAHCKEGLDSAANGCLRGRLLLFRLKRKRFGARLPGGVHGCQGQGAFSPPGEGRPLSVDLRFAATRPGRRLYVSSAGGFYNFQPLASGHGGQYFRQRRTRPWRGT